MRDRALGCLVGLPLTLRRRAVVAVGMVLALALVATTAFAAPSGVAQASISLKNAAVEFCNVQENEWTLEKTNDQAVQPVDSPTDVTWTITAAKTAGAKTICANGYIQVTNTGSANATIGNIVVNLQKPRSGPNTGACKNIAWVSAAADVATAFAGDPATSANIVANGSAENVGCNAVQGPQNYVVSGAKGTFTETAASGELKFIDADSNDEWAITPEQVIPPGGTVNLFFSAKFDNDVLNFPDGQSLRVEAIVTFGNAGGRGGSGATATNIDIDGSGGPLSPDEANVRSVPARVAKNLPALLQCNDQVTLEDALSTSGTAGYENLGGDTFPLMTSTGGQWTVTATVTGGAEGGTVTNTVTLTGESTPVVLTYNTGQIDPGTGLPIMAEKTFPCCEGADLEAESSVDVSSESGLPPEKEFADGGYCTHTVQQWPDENHQPHNVVIWSLRDFDLSKFTAAFPSGLRIGVLAGGSVFDALWESNATGYSTLPQAISNATGAADSLSADLTNPISMDGGEFTGEVAALALNVGFSGSNTSSGTPVTWPAGLGLLTYYAPGQPLNGSTIAQILAAANDVASGNADPIDYGFDAGQNGWAAFKTLLGKINDGFGKATTGADSNTCKVKQFAQDHLRKP